jgi:hypothetical protein
VSGAAFPPAPVLLPVAVSGFTPAGVGDGALFDLNKCGNFNLNFRGVGEAIGVGLGVGDNSAVVFLRTRLGVGEATGDSVAEDASLWAGGVVSVVFCARCFDGEADSAGVPVSSCG